MSKMLAELLQAKQPHFSHALRELEASSFHPAVDIRLTNEVEDRARQKLRELGLDPRDTTGPELYQGLQDLVAIHDSFLARALGVEDPADIGRLLPRLVQTVQKLPVSRSCFGLKHGALKRLLKQQTPKKTMKQLGYRSADSMLKREPAALILAAARLVEGPQWQKQFTRLYAGLDSTDFEIRPVEILQPATAAWQRLGADFARRSHQNILQLPEAGALVVLPLPVRRLRGASIVLLSMLVHQLNELRLYSTFFKMQQMKPHFGSVITDILLHDMPSPARLAGQQLHWRVLHRYFGRQHASAAAFFEPHVQPEDLEWRQAEALLYRIEPALKFWEGLDYVGTLRDGRPISFNLLDNALNYCNHLEYGRQTAHHMQANLWDELYLRYLQQETFASQIASQFEEQPGQEIIARPRRQRVYA